MRRWGTGIGNGWAQAWALVIEVARPGMETAEEAQAVRLGGGNWWAQAWAHVIEVARPGMETAEEAQAVRLGGGYEHHWRRGESFELSLRRGNIAQGNTSDVVQSTVIRPML